MAASKKEEPIIEVKHLSKQYGIGVDKTYKTFCESFTSAVRHPLKTLKDCRMPNDTFWALKDVNFEIEQGEVVGIIGRNGAGKSTLLKILSRITYPTEGEIIMHGRVGSLLEVGTGFHPELTGRENIYFNGAILGMKKREIDDKFDEIVKFSGVEKFLDTPVKRYSSGMQVRLAFSVASHLEPEILLVDEVLAVGDAEFQKKCLGKMENVAKEGRTVLFVSHNMAAVQNLCSRGILLNAGRNIFCGDMVETLNQYLSNTDLDRYLDSPGKYNLSNRVNLFNKGKTIIQRVQLFNEKNQLNDSFLMGRSMKIAVEVEGMSNHQGAQIGINFQNFQGQRITSIGSFMSCKKIETPRQYKEIAILYINKIPFTPGKYWVNISISNHSAGEYLDKIENEVSFNVEAFDIYGSGNTVTSEYGQVYINATWEICDINSIMLEDN